MLETYLKPLLARALALLFLAFSLVLGGLAVYDIHLLFTSEDLITTLIRSINTAFIALATFELGVGIGKEYSAKHEPENIFPVVRRTITRFVGVVTIALSLEGLVMVIKYSQMDLAGNLYYPVAIILSAAFLLLALGVFIRLTEAEGETSLAKPRETAETQADAARTAPPPETRTAAPTQRR